MPRRVHTPMLAWILPACGPEVGGNPHDAASTSMGGSTHATSVEDGGSTTTASPAGGEAVQVAAAGAPFTCALLNSGDLRCWGQTLAGGAPIGDDEPASAAPQLSFGESVAAVSAGYSSACVVLSSKTVACWGYNDFGVLGYGDLAPRNDPTNERLDLGGPAAGVVSRDTACARLLDGRVRCWGLSWQGMTGSGASAGCGADCGAPMCCIGDDERPADSPAVDVGAPVAGLDVGGSNVCALTTDGRVRVWGSAAQGGLGDPTSAGQAIGDDETPAAAQDVDLGDIAVAVACGSPSCALLRDGTLRCWGGIRSGYGTNEIVGDDESPAAMGAVPLPGPVQSVAASPSSLCAVLADGSLYCWGRNDQGQLGLGHTDAIGDDEPASAGGPIDVGGPVAQVSPGDHHTCAILVDGSLRCWGFNEVGQLGYGHTQTIGDDETPASAGPVPWLP